MKRHKNSNSDYSVYGFFGKRNAIPTEIKSSKDKITKITKNAIADQRWSSCHKLRGNVVVSKYRKSIAITVKVKRQGHDASQNSGLNW